MLVARFAIFVKKHNLIAPDKLLIVGLSGGPDSVFLLHMLIKSKIIKKNMILAAHLDHGWRQESLKDLQFCAKMCESLGVKFESAHACDVSSISGDSVSEELGRELRRKFFSDLFIKYNAGAVALAHHADDQQETFFLRLIRGASLEGLVGIRPKSGIYMHPLLDIYKSEILDWLQVNNISYVVDKSNYSNDFLRNRIRNNIIPEFCKVDNRFDANFAKTLNNLTELDSFLSKLTLDTLNVISESVEFDGINLSAFLDLNIYLKQRILILWLCNNKVKFNISTAFLQEILRFLNNNKSKYHNIYPGWAIVKEFNIIRIVKYN